MKSKIRSRWYRSNEKPLESNSSTPSTQAPFGEINLSEDQILSDDLSNASPPKASERRERPPREREVGRLDTLVIIIGILIK